MTPYIISKRNNNTIECNTDCVVTFNSRIILLSLLDISAKVKKVLSDTLQHGNTSDITLRDREDVFFEESLTTYETRFRYKLTRHSDGLLTHGIIYNTDQENYIFDWEGEGLVKTLSLYLRNKCYLPVTDDIVKQVLELDIKNQIISECDVHVTNEDMKQLNVWRMNSVGLFKELLEKVELDKDDSFDWSKIEDVSDYLVTFVEPIKDRLSENIEILYDANKVNPKIFEGKKRPYDGQISLIQGGIETLKQKNNKFLYLAAEPGSGKSLMGAKINHVYHHEKEKENYCTLLVAPATTLTQWKKEINDSIGGSVDVLIVKNTNEFIQFYNKTKMRVNKPTYILVGKETFKLSYKMEHGVNVVKRKIPVEVKKTFWTDTEIKTTEVCTCPDCGLPLRNPLRKSKTIFFTEKDFRTAKKSNYKCIECEAVLFQAVYVRNRKTSVIDFIKRKNIKVDSVIIDEAHEGNGDSIIGLTSRDVMRRGKKVILLSGTVTNGYASSIYNVLFGLVPNTLKRKKVFEKDQFIKTYGTLMTTTKHKDSEYHVTNRTQIRDSAYREIEGVNPRIFAEFMASNFISAELDDLKSDIPKPVEKYIGVEPLEEMKKNEYDLSEGIKKASPFNASFYDNSVVKHYANNPFNWGEIPFEFKENSDKQNQYVQPVNINNQLLPKEQELINILREEVNNGRKSWIYCDFVANGKYTDHDTLQERLEKILIENGFKVFVLKSSVSTLKRAETIEKVKDGYDIFLGHPKLTSVGINLQWCTNYIFYTPSYHVNTVRQAKLRGRRINSKIQNKILHLYYTNSVEEKIMTRYKLKLAESEAIESRFNSFDSDSNVERTASKLGAQIERELTGAI